MAVSSTPRVRFPRPTAAPARRRRAGGTITSPQTPSTHYRVSYPATAPADPSRIGFGGGSKWHAVFFVGDVVGMTPSSVAANSYEVYDYRSNLVAAASFTPGPGSLPTIVPTAGGNWAPGWYRVLWYGPVFDYTYHFSYGSGSFCVIRDTPGFKTMPGFFDDPGRAASADIGGEFRDVVMKGVLGVGTSRGQITDVTLVDPTNIYAPSGSPGGNADSVYSCQLNAQWVHDWQPSDPARPWDAMMEFPNGTAENFIVGNYLKVYCKDATIDGSKVFVGAGPGTTSGSKITVSFPTAGTIVETYDNLGVYPTAETAINGHSNYIHIFQYNNGPATTQAPTAIGNAAAKGVVNAVSYLYPFGMSRFEGPSNEPGLNAETAFQMNLFKDRVHLGNPNAKAIGPAPVSVNTDQLAQWDAFFTAGGAPDEISTHMYSTGVGGDVNEGRHHFDRWYDLLKRHGVDDLPVWVTESTQTSSLGWAAVARDALRITLLMEQYGLPRERNQYWYDISHGFWSVPVWLENEDGTLQPQVVLYRVLAEETWGQLHHHAIDFGSVQGNAAFLGSVYKNESDGTSTAVVISNGGSGAAGFTVTFIIDNPGGAIPSFLPYVNGLGVASNLNIVGGKVTMPVEDIPGYLHLPAGFHVYVDHCNNWPNVPNPSISQYARGSYSGAQPNTVFCDNQWVTFFQHGQGLSKSNQLVYNNIPDTAEMFWNDTVVVDSVVVFAAMAVQQYSTLADFDVETTADNGATWTLRATYTSTDLQSFWHPMDGLGTGGFYEVFWDPQFVFDIPLGGTFSVNGLRLKVRATSYGGLPNIEMARFGLGYPQHDMSIALQEIVVPSASTPSAYTDTYANLLAAEASLVGWWRFNDSNYTSGQPAVSQVNAPTVNGTYTAFGNRAPAPGPIADGAGAVQQSNDGRIFMQSAGSSTLSVGDTFTVELWHNPGTSNGAPSSQFITMVYAAGHTLNIGYNQTHVTGSISIDGVASSSTGYIDGNWHHVVVTKNGATTKIYIDGQDVTVPGTNVTYTGSYSSASIGIGSGSGGAEQFANLALYSTALSASDVKDHYYASSLVTAPPATDTGFFAPAPTIAGTVAVGGQLQASSGHWTNNPTFYEFQWQSTANPDGVTGATNIGGATRSDYIPASSDHGMYLTVLVTASNIAGAGTPQRSLAAAVGGSPITGLQYFVQEEDGTSHFTLEEGGGALLTEESGSVGPPLSVGEYVGVVPIF